MNDYERDYLFDLQGFTILDQALDPAELAAVNAWIDARKEDKIGQWLGRVEVQTYSGNEGLNYQNIIEGGAIFEGLIDHPSWYPLAERWMVNDYNSIALNEAFLNVRRAGGFIGIHSGGHVCAPIMSFRNANTGTWNLGQLNVLVALTDIGPGDGCTMVVPGSHKSALLHPELVDSPSGSSTYRSDRSSDGSLAAIEVHLRAGQAVAFTDSITHGASARVNPGERRVLIYRYSPHSITPRYNYAPSPALLERLSARQRAVVQPIPPRHPPQEVPA